MGGEGEKDHPRAGDVYVWTGSNGELCLVTEITEKIVYVALLNGNRWWKTWCWRIRFSEDVRSEVFSWTRVREEG